MSSEQIVPGVNLTVSVASDGPVGSPIPTDGNLVGLEDNSGNLRAGRVGQQTMANSQAVVIASDQPALPANITEVGGAALALGQALMAASIPVVLSSNQSDVPVNVAQIGGSNLSLGQALMASSIPVVLSSNQSDVPVNIAEVGGAALALGQALMAASVPVVLSSNQSDVPVNIAQVGGSALALGFTTQANAIPTVKAPNTNGSQATASISGATATTLTAPANAVGFILQASDQNTTNFRWQIGGTAGTDAGQQLQPGRDTGFIPCAANISVIVESGTCEYEIQWILSH